MSNPEEFSEPGGSSPAEKLFAEGDLPVFETLVIFDETRELLYGWARSQTNVTIETIDEISEEAGGLIQDTAEAFGELGAQIAEGDLAEEMAQSVLANIWRDDNRERMSLFYGLTGCEGCFEIDHEAPVDYDDPVDENDLAMQNIQVAFLQSERFKSPLHKTLESAYMAVAVQEIGSLLGHLGKGNLGFHEEDEPPADFTDDAMKQVFIEQRPRLTSTEKLISYSVDVTKIAIGASIALWLGKRFYRG